jgi:hypothetical protein
VQSRETFQFRDGEAPRDLDNISRTEGETHLKGIHEAVDSIVSFMKDMRTDAKSKNVEKCTTTVESMFQFNEIGIL